MKGDPNTCSRQEAQREREREREKKKKKKKKKKETIQEGLVP